MTVNEAIAQSADELRKQIEEHQRLVARADEEPDVVRTETCRLLECPCRRCLRQTVAESITVLEETRRAFKSKQLEQLRKKLMRVLAENA